MSGSGNTQAREDLDVLATAYAHACQQAGPAARDRLRDEFVEVGLPFARRLARRYRGRGEALDDLEQVARLGLVKAVERYDAGRGSFTAYAVITITGELKKHFRDHTWAVHVPRRLQDLGLEMNRAAADLTKQHSRAPTNAELATHLGVSETDVIDARTSTAGYTSASLNAPVGHDSGLEMGDAVGSPDPDMGLVDDQTTVERLLCRLPARERRMLALRFYGNLSQAEIAEALGISQMHVSRLLSRALTWLRAAMLNDVAPPWPGIDDTDHRVRAFKRRVGDQQVRVHVSGEIDRDNADHLRQELLAAVGSAGSARLVVDLSDVPFLDAAGIAVLVAVWEAARVREVAVRVEGLQPSVARVVAASGIGSLLGL